MARPTLTPAQRAANLTADADLTKYAAESIIRSVAAGSPDQAVILEAAKVLEAVGCRARRNAAKL